MNHKGMKEVIKNVTLAVANKEFRQLDTYVRAPILFWGIAGTGKTHGIIETSLEEGIPTIVNRLSQEAPEDLSFPLVDGPTDNNYVRNNLDEAKRLTKVVSEKFPRTLPTFRKEVIDGVIVETDEYQIDIKSVKNYIPEYPRFKKMMEDQGLSVNDAKGCVIFFDELNRIADKEMFQMIFQILEEGKFHNYSLPENAAVFGACNPATSEYIIDDWFADDAFSNRCIHIKLEADHNDFLDFAHEAGYEQSIIDLVRSQPEVLFKDGCNDFELPELTRSLRNLRFLDSYVANNKIDWSPEIRNELINRLIGTGFAGAFNKIENEVNISVPSANDILSNYDDFEISDDIQSYFLDKDNRTIDDDQNIAMNLINNMDQQKPKSNIRKRILDICSNSDQFDLLTRVVNDLVEHIAKNKGDDEFHNTFDESRLKFLRFTLDLPRGLMHLMMSRLYSDNETSVLMLMSKAKKEDLEDDQLDELELEKDKLVNSHIELTVEVLTKLDEVVTEQHAL